MMKNSVEIKYQMCLLCDALNRNINDNFESVSFKILKGGDIQTRVILIKRTDIEDEIIDDFIAEFAAPQVTDCIRAAEVIVDRKNAIEPFEHLVYRVKRNECLGPDPDISDSIPPIYFRKWSLRKILRDLILRLRI